MRSRSAPGRASPSASPARTFKITKGQGQAEQERLHHSPDAASLPNHLNLRALLGRGEGDGSNYHSEATQRLNQTVLAQPALFVIEYALAQLWLSWGFQPQAMIGYSLGEYVAACLAGVMSLEDTLAVIAMRAQMI